MPGWHVKIVSNGWLIFLQKLSQLRQSEDEDMSVGIEVISGPMTGTGSAPLRPKNQNAESFNHIQLHRNADALIEQKNLKTESEPEMDKIVINVSLFQL